MNELGRKKFWYCKMFNVEKLQFGTKPYEALCLAIRKNSSKFAKKILNQPNIHIVDERWLDYILLIKALQRGCRRITRLLLKHGCRVNAPIKTNFYHTPLYYAVRLKDIKLIKVLLSKGAFIYGRDVNDESPFALALAKKYDDIIDIMLSEYLNQKVDLSYLNIDDYNVFKTAYLSNNEHLINVFLKNKDSIINFIQSESNIEFSQNALHVAVKDQNLEEVKFLLKETNINIHHTNGKGETALHLAYYMKEKRYPSKVSSKIIDLILFEVSKTDINIFDKMGVSYFHIACTRNETNIVKHFIELDVDINSLVSFNSSICQGYTPLHFAIKNKQENIIQILLDNKADPTIKNASGDTAFHFIFSYFQGDDNIITHVLTNYIPKDINLQNKLGLSHFHIACCTNNINAIETFLNNGVPIDHTVNFNSQKCSGYSPLHFAVTFNRKAAVQLLLQRGANPNQKDSQGCTPLHLACQQDAKKIHRIIRNSIPPHFQNENFETAIENSSKESLQSITDKNEQIEIVNLLLENKSDVNARDNTGQTPLFYACEINYETFMCEFSGVMSSALYNVLHIFCDKRLKIVKTLLVYKPKVDIIDNCGRTILHHIAGMEKIYSVDRRAEIANALLRVKADVNARSKTGMTPLHVALKKANSLDLIEIFFNYNVNPNVAEYENLSTPLHFATYNDMLVPKTKSIIRDLLDRGADAYAKQLDGKTPFHIAASTKHSTACLTPLLSLDCDVNYQDVMGSTALHMACTSGNSYNVNNLLNCGADVNIKDINNRTPFMCFCKFQRDLDEYHEIYYIFKHHFRKLKELNFYVNPKDMVYYKKLKNQHKKLNLKKVNSNKIQCREEIEKMKNIVLNKNTNLYDVLYKDPNEMIHLSKNPKLLELIESRNFRTTFWEYNFLILLQYQRGRVRGELLNRTISAFQFVLGFGLPDSCCEQIFRYLSNKSLENINKAEFLKAIVNK